MKIRWPQRIWRWRSVIAIAPSVAVLTLVIRSVGLLQAWEWAAFDQYTRLLPAEPLEDRVVIVGIDEQDLAALDQYLISDEVLADAIAKIAAAEPRAIGLDLYRGLPVAPGSKALDQVFRSTPNLIGIHKVVGELGRDTVSAPPALSELGQIGANDLIADADNTVRRGPIWLTDAQGDVAYSFSFFLALLYLEQEGISLQEVEQDVWWLGKTLHRPFESNDGGYANADAGGYQQIIRYRSASPAFESVSFTDVLTGNVAENWATDKVVLIGATNEGANDDFFTPHSSTLLSLPQKMFGVEIHASLVSQLIRSAMEGRPIIQSWPEWIEALWTLSWSTVGVLLVWQFDHTKGGKRRRWLGPIGVVTASVALIATTYVPFLFGWWIPLIPPLIAAGGSATVMTAYLARRASSIRRTFGRYLSDEIVTTLLEHPEGQKLGGDRKNITILTSDLRGFTATAERLSPEVVINVLNFYLGCMADVITQYGGTIDEFMGDGILVLFGAPISRQDDAQRAVACAVAMQLAMAKVNEQMKVWSLAPLEMGIGIHTGEVVVGNIGSEKRTKYGVVGAPVNLTYRIEAFTTGGQILISQETLAAASPVVQVRRSQSVKPKGVIQPIRIFEVGGVGAPYNLALRSQEDYFIALKSPIKVCFSVLQEKSVSDAVANGYLVELSEEGAVIRMTENENAAPAALDNIKLNLALDVAFDQVANHAPHRKAIYSGDTYAKVTELTQTTGVFQIKFTSKPPAVSDRLQKIYKAASAYQQPMAKKSDGEY